MGLKLGYYKRKLWLRIFGKQRAEDIFGLKDKKVIKRCLSK
jgi:hypothetical protein